MDAQDEADPSSWFDRLYVAADRGEAVVPWDLGTPNPLLAQWVEGGGLGGRRPRAVVVGAGYGRDSEYLASLGLPTSAFDLSPAAVARTRTRFPESSVDYRTADLLSLPPELHHAYELVVESMTVQALPEPERSRAIHAVPTLVAPGGTLLVIAFGHDGPAAERDRVAGPPWPLLREDVEAFGDDGLETVRIERFVDDDQGAVVRWRAELRRPR
ncbi:MAG: class I SAM-dependent methyltransferase [Actinomycetota bacterium]|nr:class I SAM-dependent methyltransferase [Actinomycetota bacterium]